MSKIGKQGRRDRGETCMKCEVEHVFSNLWCKHAVLIGRLLSSIKTPHKTDIWG